MVDARLVEHGLADGEAPHQLQAIEHGLALVRLGQPVELLGIDQAGIVDQLRQHHRHGLQGLDLDTVVAARLSMLHGKHANRPLAPDDRYAGEGMELLLTGLRAVLEFGMRRRLVEVEGLDILGDGPGEALAHAQPGDVHRTLFQPARREQFEQPIAQQVDRANLARQRVADDVGDLVQLVLSTRLGGHELMQLREDQAGCRGGGHSNHL